MYLKQMCNVIKSIFFIQKLYIICSNLEMRNSFQFPSSAFCPPRFIQFDVVSIELFSFHEVKCYFLWNRRNVPSCFILPFGNTTFNTNLSVMIRAIYFRYSPFARFQSCISQDIQKLVQLTNWQSKTYNKRFSRLHIYWFWSCNTISY